MSSASNPDRHATQRALILAGVVILSAGTYLLISWWTYGIGFPLDDAWIHQTYARNLAEDGEWAFLPGEPSAGSTAPLWSTLLAGGSILRLGPYLWTYLLGALVLWALAILVEHILRKRNPAYQPCFPWAGILIALEWHLVWLADSGMETLLSALLVTLVLTMLLSKTRHWFGVGILTGLSVWVRPDGISLLGPAILAAFLTETTWKYRIQGLVKIILGSSGLFALYLLFNLKLAGSPWPNTFYAKQAEYASYLEQPFLTRLIQEPLQLFTGVGALLLPGVLITLITAYRQREWGVLIAAGWVAGLLILYAWRLPVTYQYGRYIVPAMPIYIYLGMAGSVEFLARLKGRWQRVLSTSWKLATGFTLLLFWGNGALIYARDVAIIESEMVTTARWVETSIPPDALVAAHDIGALGYFGDHDLVDLAGLISPEVIPFLRDERQIAIYLDEQQADYLVTFPDWYPSLIIGREAVFTTDAPYAPKLGETNMTVYRWSEPK